MFVCARFGQVKWKELRVYYMFSLPQTADVSDSPQHMTHIRSIETNKQKNKELVVEKFNTCPKAIITNNDNVLTHVIT